MVYCYLTLRQNSSKRIDNKMPAYNGDISIVINSVSRVVGKALACASRLVKSGQRTELDMP
jgi:hypothetical protein